MSICNLFFHSVDTLNFILESANKRNKFKVYMGTRIEKCYGVGGALLPLFPVPLNVQRAPVSTDTSYPAGQLWFDQTNSNQPYMFDGIVWRALSSGGGTATKLGVDTSSGSGTNPVVPDGSGIITTTGAQIANASLSNVIQTASLAANTLTIQIQQSASAPSSTPNKNGVCHFKDTDFNVDPSGFVSLISSGIDRKVAVDISSGSGTNPVVPNASGIITVTGGQFAATMGGYANCIRTDSLAANTYTIEIQRSSAVSATNADQNGVSHFDSKAFKVDSNGFVQLIGSGQAITGVHPDAHSGPGTDPVVADTSGNITVTGAQVDAGTINPNAIRTDSLAANTYTIEIQRSQAVVPASAALGLNGICHFDSTSFAVSTTSTTKGFVTLIGGGFTWNDVSGAFSPLKNNGYFVTATATGTLPASPAQGDTIKFFVDTTQFLTIQATGSQIIRLGSLVSSAAGTAVSTLQGDSVELVYRASDTCWCAVCGFSGTWIMA